MTFKWHPFPKEIPPLPERFLVTVKNYDGSLYVTVLRYIGTAGLTAVRYFTESRVIAWSEIEPFNPGEFK